MNLSSYKCVKCSHEFVWFAGPVNCQKCGNDYVIWLDYLQKFGGSNGTEANTGNANRKLRTVKNNSSVPRVQTPAS